MFQPKKVRVRAPARIHLGLLDCGNATPRQYGGSGISIEGLITTVEVEKADKWALHIADTIKVSSRTLKDVVGVFERLKKVCSPTQVTIASTAPEHVGLGSKTVLLLSIVTASLAVNSKKLSRKDVVHLTRRGGASGIGVNIFWHGGFLIDAGHNVPPGQRSFLPSSGRIPEVLPAINAQSKMPTNWRISLFFDPSGKSIEGKREVEIFENSMPINDLECLQAVALTYHGLLPSIKSANLFTLARALQDINSIGMKAIELSYQSKRTQQFLQKAWHANIPAGLSSFGPCVFVIADKESDASNIAMALANEEGLEELGTFKFNNSGMDIEEV